MNTFSFRTLGANDVEVRIGNTKKDKAGNVTGYSLLLYKNARVDMAILDETLTPMNWQRKHNCLNGTIYCSVGVKTDTGEWIWKEDCGFCDGSDEIGQKGTASDSFKRACFNLGIGRELYTAPFVWISSSDTSIRYSVTDLVVSPEHVITGLTIINSKSKEVVFAWNKKAQKSTAKPQPKVINKDDEAVQKAEACTDADSVLLVYNKYKDIINQDTINKIVEIGGKLRAQEKLKKAA